MKLKHPSKYPGLKFSCGMFGVCSDVLSSSVAQDEQCSCSGGDDKENRDEQVKRASGLLTGQERKQQEQRRLQQFQRVPSSTQWELALKSAGGCNRSVKSRYSELIDLSPLQAAAAAAAESYETLSTCSEACDLDYFIAQLRSRNYSAAATLRGLRHFASESELDRRLMADLGVHNDLLLVLAASEEDDGLDGGNRTSSSEVLEEAFAVIVCLASEESVRRSICVEGSVFRTARRFLRTGSNDCKVEAATLIVKLAENEDLICGSVIASDAGIVEAVVELLQERSEARVVKAAIKGLLALCLSRDNRAIASRTGAVPILIGILDDSRGVNAERCLASLELLCTTREGREAATVHVPMLVRMILRVSDRGTEYAAGVLCSVCTPDNLKALELAFQARASTHLLLLLQSRCTERARRKALKLLKVLHSFGESKILATELIFR